ncbi:MAG: hypothetical protein IPP94_13470 [Ignavibacteria bacterium]|nr:hypothetical protein [Ignavibacteria bacterium]
MISCLNLFRQGATQQGYALLRISLEASAVAIWITSDEEAFKEYIHAGHKFPATRAISVSKKKIPQLAEIWGALSAETIHPNVVIFGPQSGANGEPTISLMQRKLEPIRDKAALRFFSVAAAIIFRAVELSLLVDDPKESGMASFSGYNHNHYPNCSLTGEEAV